MNVDTIALRPMKKDMNTIAVPIFVIVAALGMLISMQAWILGELVSGRERLVRIETKLELFKP